MQNIQTIIQGTVMGIAEVIPGVSGSTLALIMGIYDKFVDLLHSFSELSKAVLKFILQKTSIDSIKESFSKIDFKFAFLLGIGMSIAVLIFSHIFIFLIEQYPQYLYAFFFGLIIASTLAPWKRMSEKNLSEYLVIFITTTFFFFLFGISTPVQQENPSKILLFIGGIIGISGMVLPGVSGSFLLFLLGLYEYVFSTIKSFTKLNVNINDATNILIFLSDLIIGFLGFVRVLKYMLTKYPSKLMAFLIGLMIASLRILWPFMDTKSAEEVEYMDKVFPTQIPTNESLLIIGIILLTSFVTIIILTSKKSIPDKSL